MSVSRSVYLSRLRRAFLLRVHPDRFRNHSALIRSQQATLVKALSNRLTDADFLAWQSNHSINNNSTLAHHHPQKLQESHQSYKYVVERRDGSFLSASLKLSDSVEAILESMAHALEQSGAASLPAPPVLNNNSSSSSSPFHSKNSHHPQQSSQSHINNSISNNNTIDHRYDVKSRQGRDFFSFLQHHLDHDEIQRRRVSRMDAQAAAALVRKAYEFQVVDAASSLGWSSASVAVLLAQLVALHEEHGTKLHVPSFYPLRLVLTYSTPASSDAHAFDVWGGILRLNPASTPLQWLTSLQLVTGEKLDLLHHHRTQLLERTRAVSSRWGIKLLKGHSCESRDYHLFVKKLYDSLDHSSSTTSYEGASNSSSTTALTLEPIVATVEASQAMRKPVVTKEGTIRLQTGMTPDQVITAASRLGSSARAQAQEYVQQQESCQELIQQLQWQLGLHKVYRTGTTVSYPQFLQALSRLQLLVLQQQPQPPLQRALAGNSLGIASSGHFCHLADDGSVVIPYDWR